MKKVLSVLVTTIILLVSIAPVTYAIETSNIPKGIKASIEGYGNSDEVKETQDKNSIDLDVFYSPFFMKVKNIIKSYGIRE